MTVKIKLELKWQDIWIGAYYKIKTITYIFNPKIEKEFHIWICLIPCVPIHIWWR